MFQPSAISGCSPPHFIVIDDPMQTVDPSKFDPMPGCCPRTGLAGTRRVVESAHRRVTVMDGSIPGSERSPHPPEPLRALVGVRHRPSSAPMPGAIAAASGVRIGDVSLTATGDSRTSSATSPDFEISYTAGRVPRSK